MFTLTAPIAESVKQRSVVSVSIYIILSTCLSPVPSSFPSLFYNINAVIGAYAPNDQVRTRPAYASALLYECRYICLFPQSDCNQSVSQSNQFHQSIKSTKICLYCSALHNVIIIIIITIHSKWPKCIRQRSLPCLITSKLELRHWKESINRV